MEAIKLYLNNNYSEVLNQSYIELFSILAEAEEDVINGRIAPMQNTFDNIRKTLEEI